MEKEKITTIIVISICLLAIAIFGFWKPFAIASEKTDFTYLTIKDYEEPPLIIEEEKTSFFQNLFIVTDISQAYAQFDTIQKEITREGYIDARILLLFDHDCEKYSVSFQYIDEFGAIGQVHTTVKDIPHKTGDKVYVTFKNLPTSGIPVLSCDKNIGGKAWHRMYYDGEYHSTEVYEQPFLFKLICVDTCENKPVSEKYCKMNEAVQDWQYSDCSVHTLSFQRCYPVGTCENGICTSSTCEIGNIGFKFCKENSVYQKFGLGLVEGQCRYEDRLIQYCSSNHCDAGRCITRDYCGDGICNYGETKNTCPEDCPALCGDGICDETETVFNCYSDCGRSVSITLLIVLIGAGIYLIIKKKRR